MNIDIEILYNVAREMLKLQKAYGREVLAGIYLCSDGVKIGKPHVLGTIGGSLSVLKDDDEYRSCFMVGTLHTHPTDHPPSVSDLQITLFNRHVISCVAFEDSGKSKLFCIRLKSESDREKLYNLLKEYTQYVTDKLYKGEVEFVIGTVREDGLEYFDLGVVVKSRDAWNWLKKKLSEYGIEYFEVER